MNGLADSAHTPEPSSHLRGAGVWDNDTTTSTRSTTNIVVSIAGKGTIVAGQYHSVGRLTFLHGVTVGANQTLEVNGYELYGGQYGNVEIQTPSLFQAAVDIGFGQVQLDGVHGTSDLFKNDLLSIFDGKSIRSHPETGRGQFQQRFPSAFGGGEPRRRHRDIY